MFFVLVSLRDMVQCDNGHRGELSKSDFCLVFDLIYVISSFPSLHRTGFYPEFVVSSGEIVLTCSNIPNTLG